jgi:hypothetical protein
VGKALDELALGHHEHGEDGIAVSVAADSCTFHADTPKASTNCASACGSVNFEGVDRNTIGSRYRFQL